MVDMEGTHNLTSTMLVKKLQLHFYPTKGISIGIVKTI